MIELIYSISPENIYRLVSEIKSKGVYISVNVTFLGKFSGREMKRERCDNRLNTGAVNCCQFIHNVMKDYRNYRTS